MVEDSVFDIPGTVREDRRSVELEVKKHFDLGLYHEVVTGIAYQHTEDDIRGPAGGLLQFEPRRRSDSSYGFYLQDQYTVVPERLRLILGAKVEHSDYADNELQPTARFSYSASSTSTIWGGVSRAVRLPTRLDQDLVFVAPPPAPPGTLLATGSEDFQAEELVAYELGYRTLLSEKLTLDLALFYNDYDQLRGIDFSTAPYEVANEGEGQSHGLETVLQWRATPQLLHRASYVFQEVDFGAKPGSSDVTLDVSNENDPRHQLMLHSSWTFDAAWHVDSRLRYVSRLADRRVADYTELDIALNWQASRELSFSLLGQNLLHGGHVEFNGAANAVEIPRALLLTARWSW